MTPGLILFAILWCAIALAVALTICRMIHDADLRERGDGRAEWGDEASTAAALGEKLVSHSSPLPERGDGTNAH